MKVLIFTTQFYRLGGAEKLQVELARRLNCQGVRADILGMYGSDDPEVPEMIQRLQEMGVPQVHFLGLKPHPSAASLVAAVWQLRRLVTAENYDVVETSGPTPSAIALLALQGTRVRHVAGIHQVYHVARDTNSSVRVLRLLASLDRRVRYYAVSHQAANAWVSFAAVGVNRIRIIYNGIEDEFFSSIADRDKTRSELNLPKEAIVLLYAGRLATYKGISTTLDAVMPILADQHAILLFVGDIDENVLGSAEEVKQLKLRATKTGIADKVRFLGQRDDLSKIMRAADLLVHPTHIEAFGLVLIEALASGLPVVSTNVEAIPDILNETGSPLVAPGDAQALHEAIVSVLSRTSEEKEDARRRGFARALSFRMAERVSKMLDYLK